MEHGQRRRLPVRFDKAMVVLTSGPRMGDVLALDYRDDGVAPDEQAGDRRYTNHFVPSQHEELAQASAARIEVYVEVEGMKRRFLRDFTWAPRPVLEVMSVRDAVEGGALVATLSCDVFEDGLYTVYGNLFGSDGKTPIAAARRSYPLAAGHRSVKLVFFGKVLTDRGIDGPYVVKDVHGVKRQGAEEYNNVWWSWEGEHRTRGYSAGDFSDAPWDDPERRARLAAFERVIADQERRDH
jgi:hypothetical protein